MCNRGTVREALRLHPHLVSRVHCEFSAFRGGRGSPATPVAFATAAAESGFQRISLASSAQRQGGGDGGENGGDGGDLGLPQAWIQAVRDVLPGVPFSTIIRDLTKTRSVNRTVNNLLEGAG